MSLSKQEKADTIKAFKSNIELLGASKVEIAAALNTSPKMIDSIINLKVNAIEEPWILKNYLEEQLKNKGIEASPFTALKGDYHDYWFLDSQKIETENI